MKKTIIIGSAAAIGVLALIAGGGNSDISENDKSFSETQSISIFEEHEKMLDEQEIEETSVNGTTTTIIFTTKPAATTTTTTTKKPTTTTKKVTTTKAVTSTVKKVTTTRNITTRKSPTTVRTTQNYQAAVYNQQSNMVWIPTNGGHKYHTNPGCSQMIDPQQVSVSEAEAMGFTPCKRCYG